MKAFLNRLDILISISTLLSASAEKIPVNVGDNICVTGYVMDTFCINLGRLLDDSSVVTLSSEGPPSHSIHCLIEVGKCVNSPFEILTPLDDGSGNFGRAWTLESNTKVIDHAKQVGDCRICQSSGTMSSGYQATIEATVLNTGTNTTPALIQVTNVQDYDVGCNGVEYEIPNVIATATKEEISLEAYTRLVLIHGSIMLLGWGLLLPSGVIIALLGRHRPNGLWFSIHSILQPSALLLVIIAWWIALANFSALTATGLNRAHAVCGMITMCLGLLQPINALFRPHIVEGERKSCMRLVWEIIHKGIGYVILGLASATIVMGTRITPVKEDGNNFLIAYIVFVSMLVFLIIALLLDKFVLYKPMPAGESK